MIHSLNYKKANPTKMPCCSYCRSNQHTIRNCNSPEVYNIVSRLTHWSSIHAGRFDFSGFFNLVQRMTMIQLKISALFWHISIPPHEHQHLLTEGDQIPLIQCNYSRDKYVYIVAWLYLNYAVRNSAVENFEIEDTSVARMFIFIERLRYLQRIVINGMSHPQSNNLYIERVVNNRQIDYHGALLHPDRRPRIIDFNHLQYNQATVHRFNNKFKFIIEELGNSCDFAKEQLTDCPICYESIGESCIILGCKHATCSGCFISYLKTRKTHDICCSLCRADIVSVKTYNNQCITDLKKYNISCNENPPHVPEVFDEGENIVINLV